MHEERWCNARDEQQYCQQFQPTPRVSCPGNSVSDWGTEKRDGRKQVDRVPCSKIQVGEQANADCAGEKPTDPECEMSKPVKQHWTGSNFKVRRPFLSLE